MIETSRRGILKGAATAGVIFAAPAIVRASSIMPVKATPSLIYSVDPYLTDANAWYVQGSTVRHIGGINMAQLRELLRPGLLAIEGDYSNWARIFGKK